MNTVKLNVPLSQRKHLIKLTLKDGTSHTFQFSSSSPNEDRETVKDSLGSILAQNKLGHGFSASSSSSSNTQIESLRDSHSENSTLGLSQEEMTMRLKILESHPELAKLHKRLVQEGTLTESEFWDMRKVKEG